MLPGSPSGALVNNAVWFAPAGSPAVTDDLFFPAPAEAHPVAPRARREVSVERFPMTRVQLLSRLRGQRTGRVAVVRPEGGLAPRW